MGLNDSGIAVDIEMFANVDDDDGLVDGIISVCPGTMHPSPLTSSHWPGRVAVDISSPALFV